MVIHKKRQSMLIKQWATLALAFESFFKEDYKAVALKDYVLSKEGRVYWQKQLTDFVQGRSHEAAVVLGKLRIVAEKEYCGSNLVSFLGFRFWLVIENPNLAILEQLSCQGDKFNFTLEGTMNHKIYRIIMKFDNPKTNLP